MLLRRQLSYRLQTQGGERMIPDIYWIEKAQLATNLATHAVEKGDDKAAVALLVKAMTALGHLKEANKWQIV